jgi:hypothetical protein
MKRPSRHRVPRPRRSAPDAQRPLDALAKEAIELFALLLARCNYSRDAIMALFTQALTELPFSVGAVSDNQAPTFAPDQDSEQSLVKEDSVPARVLTEWHLTPPYILNGYPRALPLQGGVSFRSLVRRIDRAANAKNILEILLKTGSVRRSGSRVVPTGRVVHLRHSPPLQRMHHLQVIVGLLRTVEVNVRKPLAEHLFQFATEGLIPISQRAAFIEEMTDICNEILKQGDNSLHRRANAGAPGEELLRMMISISFSDGISLRGKKAKS